MDTALDKQKEIDDKYRNDFVQKIQGNIEPKRGNNTGTPIGLPDNIILSGRKRKTRKTKNKSKKKTKELK